jgi:hypothetical protein
VQQGYKVYKKKIFNQEVRLLAAKLERGMIHTSAKMLQVGMIPIGCYVALITHVPQPAKRYAQTVVRI